VGFRSASIDSLGTKSKPSVNGHLELVPEVSILAEREGSCTGGHFGLVLEVSILPERVPSAH
jgi:hypothetical protein